MSAYKKEPKASPALCSIFTHLPPPLSQSNLGTLFALVNNSCPAEEREMAFSSALLQSASGILGQTCDTERLGLCKMEFGDIFRNAKGVFTRR